MADLQRCHKCRQPEPTGECVPLMSKADPQKVSTLWCLACLAYRYDSRRMPWQRIPRRFHGLVRAKLNNRMKALLDAIPNPISMTRRSFPKRGASGCRHRPKVTRKDSTSPLRFS